MAAEPRPLRELLYSWIPFGLFERKPRHYLEMLRIAWANRRRLRYAWRVLNHGVCDGCALGTAGLKDCSYVSAACRHVSRS